MIPTLLILRYGKAPRRVLPIFIPLILVWLLLSPIALLLAPLVLIACLLMCVSPADVASALWEMAAGLRGTRIEVADGRHNFSIRIL